MVNVNGRRPPSGAIPRKMLPKPFQNPSISISSPAEVKREWRPVCPHQITEGDTVPGVGLISHVNRDILLGGVSVDISGGDGNTKRWTYMWSDEPVPSVLAFVKA